MSKYFPSLLFLKSHSLYTMSSISRTDHQSFEAFRHPAFVRAVNRAANLKCIEAIKSGKLRVVSPQPTPNPSEYTPRCVRKYLYLTHFPNIFSSMDLIDDPVDSNLTAVFEIPGIKTSDISLHILEGHLIVMGERRSSYNTTQQIELPSQDTAENGISAPKRSIPIRELRFGTFRRSVPVPDGLKVSFLLLII